MKTKLIRALLVSLVIVVAGFVLASSFDQVPAAEARHEVQLQAPPFLNEAGLEADSAAFDIGERLDDEAGISAWCQSPMPINLNVVRGQYQTIELETTDYILGSVSAPGYSYDEWDQHVYVHTDGWILAYYMNTDVTGRMIHLLGKTIDSTLLENMVATMAGVAGVTCSPPTLYDFRYPNATHMLFIAEDDANGSTYTLYMPTSYVYIERSWAKWNSSGYCNFTIDGVHPPTLVNFSVFCIGPVTYAQLQPGVTHQIDVNDSGSDYGVLVVTYAVP